MQHITEKEIEVLKYFYEHRKGHVRHINKFIKLSVHTLLKYLASLEIRGVLASRKEGNLKIYEINIYNDLSKLFFQYFDIERLNAIEYYRAKAIKEFVYRIKTKNIPYFIILFGSSAKGNYTKKSDIDLIIVYTEINKNLLRDIEELKKKTFAETGIKVNSVLMQLKEFYKEKDNKQNFALQDALTYGYPIFGSQFYYEVMFK